MKLKKIISGLTSLALSLSVFAGGGIARVSDNMKAEAASSWKFDLGGGGAASGFTGVSASDKYSKDKGYGFSGNDVKNVAAAGKNELSDAVQFTGKTNLNVDVPNGIYKIKVTLGNTSRTSVFIEDMLQIVNMTGNNAVHELLVPVTDGQLNIRAGAGKSGTTFSISAIEMSKYSDSTVLPPTIWLCGDSTVCNYYPLNSSTQAGWGQMLGNFVDKDWNIRNMAASGEYAQGFINNGNFAPIEKYGKKGDVFIISIGINDGKYYKGDDYKKYVGDMTKRAKAKGMDVILVKQQGRKGDYSMNPLLKSRYFSNELEQIAKEQDCQIVDLFNLFQNYCISIGAAKADAMYIDNVHPNREGATHLAELVAKQLKQKPYSSTEPVVTDPPVTEATDIIDGQIYNFKSVNSGLYLNVEGGNGENGANIQQAANDGKASQFKAVSAGNGYYYLVSQLGDGESYAVDVNGKKTADGTNIEIYTFNNGDNQQFKFVKNSDGSYTILTKITGDASALDVNEQSKNSGANVQQWVSNGNNCQKWIIEKADYTSQIVTTTTTAPEPVTTTTTTSAPVEHRIKKFPGNANCDSNVSMADAVLIMQSISNGDKYGEDGSDPTHITAQGKINADVDGNGSVTPADALFIQKVMLKLDTLPEIEYEDVIPEPITTTTSADPYAGYYFAVDQTWSEGIIESANGGFTKTAGVGSSDKEGYINLDNNDTSNITFTVNVEADGNYMTHIRFANGSTADRSMMISVNGGTDMTWLQSFPGTGDWTTWAEYGIVLPLKAGKNTIKMVSHVAGQGGPNLDYITLTLTDEPFAQPYDPNEVKPGTVSDRPAIYIAGDSTAQSYGSRYAPQQGWGYYAGNYYTDNVTVVNKSIGGRSSKKFYDEGRFKEITDVLKEGDFVFIQFAINDAGKTNADRYAPTCGNVDNPSSGSYEWYMTQFIKDTLAKKATPVLMSCTLSGKSYSNGKFVASYTNYTDACKKLASKYNVPFVDVNSAIVDHYNSIGYDKAKSYHLAGAVSGSTDLTHYCEEGANKIAGVIANAVKKANISGLSEYVK